MKMERSDMHFNMAALSLHLVISLLGLHFYKSLDVIYYSILISFITFHILQDILLIRKGYSTIRKSIMVYFTSIIFILLYQYLANTYNPYIIFFAVGTVLISIFSFMSVKVFRRVNAVS